jgi:tRNA pseudouridine55 synthase
MMDGLILVNKPQNLTSHDIVARIRKLLRVRRAGHFGTLDPLATGLMMVALGKATRLFPFFSKADKSYRGIMRLGFATETYDSAGKSTSTEKKDLPPEKSVRKAMKKFEGQIEQLPPPFSAKKYKGKPLYSLAREKKEFELRPTRIFVHFLHLKKYNPPFLEFEVQCSSGTYIRSLAHDLGQSLGCGAHLSQLTRTRVGNFHLKDCFDLEEIRRLAEADESEKFLLPLESLLPEFPKVILDERGSILARNGNLVFPENVLKIIPASPPLSPASSEPEIIFRMFSLGGKYLALAKKMPKKNCFHPFLVIEPRINRTS